jgi:transcriptional regulator with XRE-family HTH domain
MPADDEIDAAEVAAAKAWRERHGWSLDDLSVRSGYSRSAIFWMERGQTAPGKWPVNPYAWQRYKRICHSVEVDDDGKTFNW